MPFPHEAILGSDFFSALVDAFLYHSWPSATRDREMHQLVLRKSQTLELPHVEKIQFHMFCQPCGIVQYHMVGKYTWLLQFHKIFLKHVELFNSTCLGNIFDCYNLTRFFSNMLDWKIWYSNFTTKTSRTILECTILHFFEIVWARIFTILHFCENSRWKK